MYGPINNAVTSPDYTAKNNRISNELCIGKDKEGGNCGLI